ncbi:MAG: hypothetical protein V4547_18315 [Bacteroidota bacterium]
MENQEINIYDSKLKYYMNHTHLISSNDEPDIYTNLMHAYNTWLNFFWSDFFGGAYWANDNFLNSDILEVNKLIINQMNGSTDDISIGLLSFIEKLKPVSRIYRRGHYVYEPQMTYFDRKAEYHPRQIFGKVMELLKHESIQEFAREELRKEGLPYMNIVITS